MKLLKPVDALLSVLVAALAGLRLIPRRRRKGRRQLRNLLVIDTSYDLAALKSRGAISVVTSRDLDGFFEHVWSTHPIVGASPAHRDDSSGPPRSETITDRHTFIEGHIAWDKGGSRWPLLSLARSQSAFLRTLDRVASTDGVSVVQVSDPYYPGALGFVLARRHRAALAVRISANYDSVFETTGRLAYPRLIRGRRIERRLARVVLSRAALVLPANENNQKFAVANGAHLDRCVIVPAYGDVLDATHLSEPAARVGASDAPHDQFLLMISRLESVKHPEDAIEVLAHVRDNGHDVSLVVAGDGSLRSELQELADQLGVADNTLLAGDRSQEWIAAAAAKSAAILSPLTGRALVEALLAGRPVVAYDVEWQGEIIADGVNGFLIPYRDSIGMAKAVERLLTDPVLAANVGQAGREHALRLVDPSTVQKLQRRAYEAAIAEVQA